MAYRLGNPLDYDPFEDEEDSVLDSPLDSPYSLGEATDFDPFENEPRASDTDEPDDGGHSLWDIPRMMGKGAAGVAKTASIAVALVNPTEWANRAIGVIGDITQNEALQAYRDYSQKHSVSAKLRQYGETAEDYYDEKLTPAMKKSMEKTILASGEEEGFWGPGIKDPWKIGGMIAESLPSTALSMGSGALITKGLAATGFKNAPKIVQGVLQKLVKKYGVNSVAGAIGGGIGEGVYSGLDNANQAFEEMMATPQAELSNSATYQEIFNSLPEKFSTEQKHAYARKILSIATGGFVGSLTAVSTGILGAPSGAFLGKLMGGEAGKSFWGNLLKGAFTEGLIEEMPQSGMEQLITNFTKKFLVDPNQQLTEGVGEAMAGGAIAGIVMGGGMAAVAGREGKKYPIKPELESDAKKILQGDQGDITARDILLGTDRAEEIRKATEGQRYTAAESIEAEEEGAQYTEEELAETAKEAPGDRKGGKQIPGKKPQRQEPKPPPLPKKGKKEAPPSGVLQKQKADEARQIKIFDAFVKKLSPRQRSRIQDLIDDKAMPIAERIGLAKAELIKPSVERRKVLGRQALAWDKPFRAIHTKAQKQTEAQFMTMAAALLKKRDAGFLDLAKRLGQTIEPGYPLKGKLKTIYARIQSGAQPRKRTQEMSKEELQKELTTDYLTGLGNKHAFEIEDKRKAHVASIDLDSLKYFNDAFGHQTGDEMLKNFGEALKPIEGSYHISGDEFIVQNDDTRALQDILENQIPKNLAANPITVTLPDGKKIKYEVRFSYGTAKTISDAEQKLQAHKAERQAIGERAGRGEIPAGLPGGPTKGRRPGDQRKEVPKTELVGGPRRAPMRTTRGETDSAAKIKKELATIKTEPTEREKETGEYKKAHFKFMGFNVSIENRKGEYRKGKDDGGREWKTLMKNHYGYFSRTEGKDGDEIDLFLGDNPETPLVFIVHQVNPKTGKPDEDKVMLGFLSKAEAVKAYMANYEKGWKGLGSVTTKTKADFADWLARQTAARKAKKKPEVSVSEASASDILRDYRRKDHRMDFGDMSEEIKKRGLKFLEDIGWSTKDDARYLRRDGTYSDRRPTVTLKELLEKGADPESTLYGDGMELTTLVRLWEPLDIRHIKNRIDAIEQWVSDNPKGKIISLDYLDMPTNVKANTSRTTRPEKELAHLRESFKIPIKDKMPRPAKEPEDLNKLRKDLETKGAGRFLDIDFKILQLDADPNKFYFQYATQGKRLEKGSWGRATAIDQAVIKAEEFKIARAKADRWIEGHLQTSDRYDRWWATLPKARDTAQKVGFTAKDINWSSLGALVAAVDAYDNSQVTEEPKPLKHFTTKERAEKIRKEGFKPEAEKPLFGTGGLGEGPKVGRFAGDALYLSLDDKAWGALSEFEPSGEAIPATGKEKPSENELFYDYEKQSWMARPGKYNKVDLVGVDYVIAPDTRVLKIDSQKALNKAIQKYGYWDASEFWQKIAKDFDAVSITNIDQILENDPENKFFQSAMADQLIVLNQDKVRIEGAPKPEATGRSNRELTIQRLGDIGTKIRFKIQNAQNIGVVFTITNIAPSGKISFDGGKTYRTASKYEAISPEEIKITAKKDIQMAMANETKVITPGNRRGYNARYAVVESNDLIPSHNAQTFQKNPDYPEGIQERTYHTDTREQEKVIKNAQHLSNAILLSDDPTPVSGPPIVTSSGIVLGGNSRAMSIARAYRGKLGDRYKEALASGASKWGLSSEYITAMDKPVLVRRVYLEKGDIDTLHRMASDFNKSLTQGISQEAEIASMGRNMSMDTVEKIGLRMANRDLTIRELLGKSDGLEILNWLIQDDVIPATDENRFVNRKVNLLNEPGKILIEKAIFGSIIDDADLISAAPKTLTNKIGRALPSLARIKARGDQWDITPEVKSALQLATEAHAADLSIREHLAQGSLFGDKKQYDNMVVGLAELLVKDKQIALANRFKTFAADAMADVKDQGFLFEPKSFQEAFNDAFDIKIADRPSAFEAIPAELMSPKDYLDFIKSEVQAGRESGITFKEKVEIEETGETIERETDAVAYLNEIEGEIAGYRELIKCVKGAT
jgi:diguanylate cyclase (GGDEF)-like protein